MHDINHEIYHNADGAIFRRTRATIRPVQPATVAISPNVSNVRHENKSSKLFNCDRNEPV